MVKMRERRCPCGSDKKYKNCCGKNKNQQLSKRKTNSFRPFTEFAGSNHRSVMPVVALVNGQLKHIGTCFAINPEGLLVTAKHVIEYAMNVLKDIDKNSHTSKHHPLYAFCFSKEGNQFISNWFPIQHAWVSEFPSDIGYMYAPTTDANNQKLILIPLVLSPGIPAMGENITGLGYYKAGGELKPDSLTITFNQKSAISEGIIVAKHQELRDRGFLKFPCFQTTAKFEHGMSGGPIFNQNGHVCGVICSGDTENDGGDGYISYGALLWSSLSCKIKIKHSASDDFKQKTIYDLIIEGYIATDESIQNINVVKLTDEDIEIGVNDYNLECVSH